MASSTNSNTAEGCDDQQNLDVPLLTDSVEINEHRPRVGGRDLDSFRQKWKQELRQSHVSKSPHTPWINNTRTDTTGNINKNEKNANFEFSGKNTKIASNNSSNINNSNNNYVNQDVERSVAAGRPQTSDTGRSCKSGGSSSGGDGGGDHDAQKEAQALSLYVRGGELEKCGQLYAAMQHYRRAIILVPDIEARATRYQSPAPSDDDESSDSEEEGEATTEKEDDNKEEQDLCSQLSAALHDGDAVCEPRFQQKGRHLGALPRELLLQVLCWVVGAELDLRSLGAVASTCKGLCALAGDEALWRKACWRVWGRGVTCLDDYMGTGVGGGEGQLVYATPHTWRHMYLMRPHPRYNGCYISKTSYFRSGEGNNFHDLTYQPWHFVCYYRFIRLFPGGAAMMLTTTDAPQTGVAYLGPREPRPTQVLTGRYTLAGSIVLLEFKRCQRPQQQHWYARGHRRGDGTTDVAETTLAMELELIPTRRRPRNSVLAWRRYVITSHRISGGRECSQVDVLQQPDSFPHLCFSRVKSYTRDAVAPLV